MATSPAFMGAAGPPLSSIASATTAVECGFPRVGAQGAALAISRKKS
eukprot:CAMPEP_0183322464 /NCGR_PEP_ID=MMETSP0160_2-20130417/71710_1 /TAXON_ID=2839 ORGANISM="Odontella Sinensis, Strain Grunow 1884" /NCGR_SAMPLE_ID=MMETSP0160_2 /ASSEMBLY_ACC=CAM_ASM_000250 /LENGTH=46 /DNA_ID= /DNA_START= /DNA_END= /DNA_ORIENTATION=